MTLAGKGAGVAEVGAGPGNAHAGTGAAAVGAGRFARVSAAVVAALFVFVLVLLTALAALSTSMMKFTQGSADGEHTFFVADDPLVNIAVTCVIAAACYLLSASRPLSGFRERLRDDRFFKRCRIAVLAVLFALSALWVFSTLAVPAADQLAVQGAVLLAGKGDWSMFAPGEYMDRYPNQYGLFWVSMLISAVAGKLTAGVIQVLNMFGILVVCSSLGSIAGRMGASRLQQLATMFLCIAFFPLVQYCTFVYGLMWGLALALLAVRLEMDFFATRRVRLAVASGACIAASILLKNNFEVFAIGMALYALVHAVDARSLKALAVVAVMVPCLAAVSVVPGVAVRAASGCSPSGMSGWSWIAMGLQDGPRAPGWFNSYNRWSYEDAGFDGAVQAQIAREDALRSLAQFASGERDALGFFTQKVASQWNNPSFQGSWVMQGSRSALGASPPVAAFLSARGTDAYVRWYLNPLQFAMLAGTLFWAVSADWKDRRFYHRLVLPLVFVGGFLCHIVWEAKSQYALPYFVLLMPYVAMGFHELNEKARHALTRPSQSGAPGRRTWLPAKAAVLGVSCALVAALLACGGYGAVTGDEDEYAEWIASGPLDSYVSGGAYLGEAMSLADDVGEES